MQWVDKKIFICLSFHCFSIRPSRGDGEGVGGDGGDFGVADVDAGDAVG